VAAGLPGAGIGGFFYLASALLLPFRSLIRRARGMRVAWRRVLTQTGLACGILGGIWLAGWIIGVRLAPGTHDLALRAGSAAGRTARLLGEATIFVSIGTLLVVLTSVQVARLLVRRPY